MGHRVREKDEAKAEKKGKTTEARRHKEIFSVETRRGVSKKKSFQRCGAKYCRGGSSSGGGSTSGRGTALIYDNHEDTKRRLRLRLRRICRGDS